MTEYKMQYFYVKMILEVESGVLTAIDERDNKLLFEGDISFLATDYRSIYETSYKIAEQLYLERLYESDW